MIQECSTYSLPNIIIIIRFCTPPLLKLLPSVYFDFKFTSWKNNQFIRHVNFCQKLALSRAFSRLCNWMTKKLVDYRSIYTAHNMLDLLAYIFGKDQNC